MSAERVILIVDHGSRRPEANEAVGRVAEKVQLRRPELVVRWAHMEIAPPFVPDVIADCVAQGAREIIVHPFFLADGRHLTETIPELVAQARERHPDITIYVTSHLGEHDALISIVLDRVDALLPS
ncbi:MAG: CbiX/SirB N-terminal domain-containing protein [Myxococcota bacterium]|nr:CbiX/SirB N-terminal domain-containing protein [Myxococcota bacterium]